MKFDPFTKPVWWRAYSFTLVTGLLFAASWALQLLFQVVEVRNDAAAHGQAFTFAQFWPRFLATTFENWQSEFLQLMTQAAGLSLLLHWGSSQSKESDDRLEAKVDELLRRLPDRHLYDSGGWHRHHDPTGGSGAGMAGQ